MSDGIAGKHSALYDGDDYIWAANSSEFGPTIAEKTIFVVSQSNEMPGGQSRYLFDSSSSSGRNAIFLGSSTGDDLWAIYPGGANWFNGTMGTLDLEFHTPSSTRTVKTTTSTGRSLRLAQTPPRP